MKISATPVTVQVKAKLMDLVAIPAKAGALHTTAKRKTLPRQKLLTTGTIQDYWMTNDERNNHENTSRK